MNKISPYSGAICPLIIMTGMFFLVYQSRCGVVIIYSSVLPNSITEISQMYGQFRLHKFSEFVGHRIEVFEFFIE